jgi:CheY-like chemotaxis protein
MDKTEFRNIVKDILNHISDPAYLENHQLINTFVDNGSNQGSIQGLREIFHDGIDLLQPPSNTPAIAPEWRCYKILTLRFLQLKEWHIIETDLGLSQRQVQRDLKKGLDALISILWDRYTKIGKNLPLKEDSTNKSVDTYDQELIKEELKNWEITYNRVNLDNIIQQALQLCNSLLKADFNDRVNLTEIDKNLSVMVDPVLTKQGIYKILSMVGSGISDARVNIRTRKLNEFFYDLSFEINHSNPLLIDSWMTGKLFFTIQGLNQNLNESLKLTIISVILPVQKQISCLVIDDVESVRRLIERMLGSYGIQVFGADNYDDALGLIQLIKPDFILLDILMPKMDGWQMMTNIAANPDTSEIPVIICSVLYEPELSQAVGAKAYIRKPINRLELIDTLQNLNLINATFDENH